MTDQNAPYTPLDASDRWRKDPDGTEIRAAIAAIQAEWDADTRMIRGRVRPLGEFPVTHVGRDFVRAGIDTPSGTSYAANPDGDLI